jgi:hypothetical protein
MSISVFHKSLPSKRKTSFGESKGDGSLMPPCKTVLLQQIIRDNSICSIWNQASVQNPIVFPPHNHGWVIEDGKFSVYWFEGNATPPTLDDMVFGKNAENSDDEETVCESDCRDDSDTIVKKTDLF